MKVRCIDNKNGALDLTVGKIYDVIQEGIFFGREMYLLTNDYNFLQPYEINRFEEAKENEEMKVLTLQEALNYPEGTKFEMGFDSLDREDYITVEFDGNDIWYDEHNTINEVYSLKPIFEAKFYLVEDKWQEVTYYEAYLNKDELRYIQGTEFDIVGTHDEILKELHEAYTYYSLTELIDMGEWYIKEEQ